MTAQRFVLSSRVRAVVALSAALSLGACGGGGGSTTDGGGSRDSAARPPDSGGGRDSAISPGDGGGRDSATPPGDSGGGCVPTVEICGDRIDQNCDGRDTGCGDADGDHFDACTVADQMSGDLSACDCDDDHATAYPGHPEECDGIDNDCNGRIDEAAACCAGCAGMALRGDICATDGSCACSTAPGMGVCAVGQTCCSGGCTDITTDITNCGYCGTACTTSSDTCSGGECRCGTGPVCSYTYACTGGSCGT
ncbi:MAG: hypothetical protein GXP55_17690 [Deltaproteobacteria bacterium]|nr:hypothetical protein [Deltaproteobacteria bacterium]